MDDNTVIRVSKIEAAKRQLDCAIYLWFQDRDAIAIHTLARAAYDVIHDLNEKNGTLAELLYNNDRIADAYKKKWEAALKKPGNFFKHADRDFDPDGEIELRPFSTIGFIMYSVSGLVALGRGGTDHTNALAFWFGLHEPELVKDSYRKSVVDPFPVELLVRFRRLAKPEFLEACLLIARERRERLQK